MMYGSWDIKCKGRFCYFRPFFLFDPPNNPKKSKFWKIKKIPTYIINLQLYTTNENHIMYGSWDFKCDRQNFLSFWAIFCLFTPLIIQKFKILKKWRKLLETLVILHMSNINQNHMIYDSWDMERHRQIFFSFCTFFCPFTPPLLPLNNQKNQKFEKMRKNPRDIIILHKCTINDYHMIYVICCGKRDQPLLNTVSKRSWLYFACRCYVTSLLLQVNCSWTYFTQGKKQRRKKRG